MGVLILLATHDGGLYLREQLLSLHNQSASEFQILAIDDASEDETCEILKEWQRSLLIEVTTRRTGLGLPDVFLELLFERRPQHDFYAFCDQDDYWHSEKLKTALHEIGNTDLPTLWVCNFSIINAKGALKGNSHHLKANPKFGNALVECVGPGCAMVWNRALMEKLRRPESKKIFMHDWWVYLSAAAFGKVIVNNKPLLNYRIHENNAVGIDKSFRSRVRRHFGQSEGPSLESQAREALRLYGELLEPAKREIAEIFIAGSVLNRLRLLIQGKIGRSRVFENVLLTFRLLIRR